MQELFPVVSGVVVGSLAMFLRPQWLRIAVFVGGCLLFGLLASFVTGELAENPGFLSIDALLVWFGGLIAVVVITGIRHRADIRRFLSTSSRN